MITQVFSKFPPEAKLWVYAANRTLSSQEVLLIQSSLDDFTQSWTAHEMPMNAGAQVLYNQLVVIALDETQHGVSGCGIDKSVKLMKDLGAQYGLDFFDRMLVLVKSGDALETFHKQSLQTALDHGLFDENTLVWNPVLTNLGDFLNKGFVKLSEFWMAPQLKFLVHAK
jgi:hypothetical protein